MHLLIHDMYFKYDFRKYRGCIMKWTHHRVSKSTWLFLLNMILVMTAAVLVLVNIRSRNELEESKRGFYSENASYLVNEENDWNAIEDILEKDDWNNGIFYKKDLQMAEDIRGVFYKGNFKKLPLISGRYFSGEEVRSDDRKAMIGRRFEKDVYEEGDRQYIDIMGEKFEVIGVLGSAQLTRMDSMKWIPLKAAAELTGAEGSYVVDGNSEKEIRNNTKLLWEVMDEDVNMKEDVFDDWALPDKTPAPPYHPDIISAPPRSGQTRAVAARSPSEAGPRAARPAENATGAAVPFSEKLYLCRHVTLKITEKCLIYPSGPSRCPSRRFANWLP